MLVHVCGVKDDFNGTLLHLECLGFGNTAGRNMFFEQKNEWDLCERGSFSVWRNPKNPKVELDPAALHLKTNILA